MREIITDDLFKMSRILDKMNLQVDFDIDVKGKTDKQLGVAIIGKIGLKAFESIHLAKDDVNEFLGDLNGMTGEEFGKLPVKESVKLFIEFKKQVPSDFFG